MAFLVNRHELGAHRTAVSLHRAATLSIGRGTGVDLRLDDPTVDFEHATIEQVAGGFRLRDLGSRSRTWVGGVAVTERLLESGDEIEIGGFRLSVQILGPENPLLVHVTRDDEAAAARASGMTEEQAFRATGGSPSPPVAGAPSPASPPAERSSLSLVGAMPPPVPRIDYAAAYRLPHGLGRPGAIALLLALVVAGGLLALWLSGRFGAFAPGELGHRNPRLVATDACSACHTASFREVSDAGCQAAGCHAGLPDHQAGLLASPSCLACHTEHRGLEGLRASDPAACVECHGELDARATGGTAFATRIAAFAPGDHPEFAVQVADLDGMRRVRLDEPMAREVDDVGIGFPHAWHLELRRGGVEVLSCRSCHRDDGKGEMLPIVFDEVCARCHPLEIDPRLGGSAAPHGEPARVLAAVREVFATHAELADDPTPEERRRIGGRRLAPAARLDEMARLATETLVAKKCVNCHAVRPPDLRAPVETLEVERARLRERWLPHARFRHAPHLERAECTDCHAAATSSRLAHDVLLPSIEACFDCHRPSRDGEDGATAELGPTACGACHTYHPTPAETAAREPGPASAG